MRSLTKQDTELLKVVRNTQKELVLGLLEEAVPKHNFADPATDMSSAPS